MYASDSGTYTTSGSGLNTDGYVDYSYCVSGSTLTLTPKPTILPVTGTVVLQKGAGGSGGAGGTTTGAGGNTGAGGATGSGGKHDWLGRSHHQLGRSHRWRGWCRWSGRQGRDLHGRHHLYRRRFG